MDETVIAARIAARKIADEVCEWIRMNEPEDARAHAVYYETVRQCLPRNEPKEKDRTIVPMTDDEARVFGETPIPWGKHKGTRVDEVPLDYLLWLLDQKDDFKDPLRRYVKSSRVQQEQGEPA